MIRVVFLFLCFSGSLAAQFQQRQDESVELRRRLTELRRAAERHAVGLSVDPRLLETPSLPPTGPTAEAQLRRLQEQNDLFRKQLIQLGVDPGMRGSGPVIQDIASGSEGRSAVESVPSEPGDLSLQELIQIAQEKERQHSGTAAGDPSQGAGDRAAEVENTTNSSGTGADEDSAGGSTAAGGALSPTDLFDGRPLLGLDDPAVTGGPDRAAIPQLIIAALRADREAERLPAGSERVRSRSRRDVLAEQVLTLVASARSDDREPVRARELFAAARALELMDRLDEALALYAEVETFDRRGRGETAVENAAFARLAQFATDEILRRRRVAPIELDRLRWPGFGDRTP